ncbi:hypothetical protein AB0F81_26040 [Actinoplanes sp. NPDC024001]|uniref:hypothetical protein n=1 Tax=Actinoplanes sp. NPDC024001 TaxID=3154598 RepID=UPI0033E5CF7C
MYDTTRLLCAAAYLDRRFTDHVVRRVLREELRAVAPSFGVDIVPVVRHCLAAQRRRLLRDTMLVLVAASWFLMVRFGADLISAGIQVLLLAWGVVFLAACLDRYQILAGFFPGRFDPGTAPEPATRKQSRLLAELGRNETGNVTVYSGFRPFVGAGVAGESWSFTTDLRKGREDFDVVHEPRPFEVDDLYAHLGKALRELDLDGLDVHHRLFVNGQDIRRQSWVLPDPLRRPVSVVEPGWIQQYLRTPTHQVRHYLVAQLVDWSGELVVSIFLRFARTGSCLVSEAAYFVLPPLWERYHAVDRLRPGADVRNALRMVARTALQAPFLLLLSPFTVGARLLEPAALFLERREIRRQIRSDMLFDYGAATSVRELGTAPGYRRYFQMLDHSAYVKLLDHAVLNAVIDFLDEHDIDTSDLKERQSVIQNNGVIVSGGGSLQAQSMAVGKGAKARAKQARDRVKVPTRKGGSR